MGQRVRNRLPPWVIHVAGGTSVKLSPSRRTRCRCSLSRRMTICSTAASTASSLRSLCSKTCAQKKPDDRPAGAAPGGWLAEAGRSLTPGWLPPLPPGATQGSAAYPPSGAGRASLRFNSTGKAGSAAKQPRVGGGGGGGTHGDGGGGGAKPPSIYAQVLELQGLRIC